MSEIITESRAALIRSNYNRVLERVNFAAIQCGRKLGDVKVVVVTKAQPVEVIQSAVQAGIRIFGENYPEETAPKINSISNPLLEWHMIGHLQSRKVKIVCDYFDFFHALDSLKLAEKLDSALAERNKHLPILLEMNVGGEEGKSGWMAAEESNWPQIADIAAQIQNYPHLKLCGLMTMPPLEMEIEQSRFYFAKLYRLRDFIKSRHPQMELPHLSMGTSLDFEAAVLEGATMIRVGQAILGPRPERY